MKARKLASVIIAKQSSSGSIEGDIQDENKEGLVSAAEDLLRAVASKDAVAVAEALKNAFEVHTQDENKGEEKAETEDPLQAEVTVLQRLLKRTAQLKSLQEKL